MRTNTSTGALLRPAPRSRTRRPRPVRCSRLADPRPAPFLQCLAAAAPTSFRPKRMAPATPIHKTYAVTPVVPVQIGPPEFKHLREELPRDTPQERTSPTKSYSVGSVL